MAPSVWWSSDTIKPPWFQIQCQIFSGTSTRRTEQNKVSYISCSLCPIVILFLKACRQKIPWGSLPLKWNSKWEIIKNYCKRYPSSYHPFILRPKWLNCRHPISYLALLGWWAKDGAPRPHPSWLAQVPCVWDLWSFGFFSVKKYFDFNMCGRKFFQIPSKAHRWGRNWNRRPCLCAGRLPFWTFLKVFWLFLFFAPSYFCLISILWSSDADLYALMSLSICRAS